MNPTPRFLPTWLLCLALCCGLSRTAHATDDRDNIAPTGWQVLSGQTGSAIAATVAGGWRVVDIKTDNAQGSTFTVTYVYNAGAYASAWWIQLGLDANTLNNYMTQNSLRPVKLIGWQGAGNVSLFGAVMVPNTGSNARLWWWYAGVTPATFYNNCLANGARPVSFDEYRIGTTDLCVGAMISNTGNDAKPWWLYIGLGSASLGTLTAQNQARLYSMQQAPNGAFNCIMVHDPVGPWYYWIGGSAQQILDLAGNLGARVYDLQFTGGVYNALFLRNDNDLTRRAGDVMRAASDGTVGVYLKQVNGPVLADLQAGRAFEPASTLKTLIHYHAMNQVRLANASLSELVTVYLGTVGSCPQATNPTSETLATVLRLMMENSDNNRTMAVETRFGRANVNATAVALGMTSTSINHQLGCGGPVPNTMSLADLGRLHEAVANGALGAQRTTFYNLMLEFPDSYAGGELDNVINQEATAVGLSAGQLSAFRANCQQAFKGGSYAINNRYYYSWGSWISLPFYGNSSIAAHEYVTGSFVDGATNSANANTAFCRGAAEVLRAEIHAAMVTFRDHVFGTWTGFGTGCRGSSNLVPAHTGLPAVPNVGGTITWSLGGARPLALTALVIGYSNTHSGSTPLPYDMTANGMPGCRLYTEPFFTLYGSASGQGAVNYAAAIPNSAALIRSHTYSQFAVFDPGANPLGIAWSNAQDLYLGGQP